MTMLDLEVMSNQELTKEFHDTQDQILRLASLVTDLAGQVERMAKLIFPNQQNPDLKAPSNKPTMVE
jgi:hypothetical protein